MPVLDWTYTAAENSFIDGIAVSENCPAANINNAIRAAMSDVMQELVYQGSISASASMSLAGVGWRFSVVSGSASIVHVGTARAGLHRELIHNGPTTYVNSANVIVSGGASYVAATDDIVLFFSKGSGAWRAHPLPANGLPAAFNEAVTASATSTDFVLLKTAAGVPKIASVSELGGFVSFSANKNAVNQTGILPSTFTKVTFTTEASDVGGYYDAANSKFTPPAGKYILLASTFYAAGVVNDSAYTILIYKNGAATTGGSVSVTAGSTAGIITTSVTTLMDANGTDYFEVYVYGVGAGNKTIDGAATNTWFQGVRTA